ncbi:ribonuclease H-like domain-containing protein [Tanacetum coccineum]
MATLISLIKENYVNGKGVHSNRVGAIQHITYTDKNLIDVIDISYLKIKVTHPNGTEAFITRVGNMTLIDYLALYDVLVVPEYCVSLMSVHKVARDSKLVIAFDEMHCYVMNQDLRKGKVLGTGKQIGGLYYFDVNQAKKTREPFPLGDHVSTELGELVHLDLWGPYKRGIPLNMWSECVLTATYLINRLPTFILNEKSPYDLWSRKCVLVGYSNSKKGYKLWSLNNKQIIYSRDVKFFEDIFPFKQNNSTGIDNPVQDVNHLIFFNTNTLDDLPEIPNDEERRNPNPIRHSNSPSHSGSTSAFSKENDAGHSQDADASASENGSFAADEENKSNSEEETVYTTLPPGYFHDNETKVCKLNKSLYGLKQAPRKWNAKLTADLLENNFMQSKSDYSLFTKSFDDVFSALLVYVDDIIITGNSLTEFEKVKQFLKTKFMIKDLGKLKYFLGIKVSDTPKGICLNQRKYCLELIDEFGLLARKLSNLPMQPYISLTSEPSDTDPLLDNVTEYQKLIGKLIYLTTTRPDIAYTVSYLSQFMHNPLRSHLKTALKVIRYLKGSPCKGINVIKGSASSIDLKAYSDADMARCADTRRSLTGYYVFMFGSLVS